MIGRMEISEILGMAGTCALLLFAGLSVETLDRETTPSVAVSLEVRAPDLPGMPHVLELLEEVHLDPPGLERPRRPLPPPVRERLARPREATPVDRCACLQAVL